MLWFHLEHAHVEDALRPLVDCTMQQRYLAAAAANIIKMKTNQESLSTKTAKRHQDLDLIQGHHCIPLLYYQSCKMATLDGEKLNL